MYFFTRISKGLRSLTFAHGEEREGCWWVCGGGEKILHRTRRLLVFHTCVTHVPRGGWFKGLFFAFALFQHTNRDCFVFFRLFTFTFLRFHFRLFCVVFFCSSFRLGRVFQFSRVFGDFTLTLSLSSSCLLFLFGQNWVFCRRNSGSLESICHPAHLRSARFHEGSSTVLASVAA